MTPEDVQNHVMMSKLKGKKPLSLVHERFTKFGTGTMFPVDISWYRIIRVSSNCLSVIKITKKCGGLPITRPYTTVLSKSKQKVFLKNYSLAKVSVNATTKMAVISNVT